MATLNNHNPGTETELDTTVEFTAEEVALAVEARRDYRDMVRAHPDLEDQLLHRVGECDGSCRHVVDDEPEVITSNR